MPDLLLFPMPHVVARERRQRRVFQAFDAAERIGHVLASVCAALIALVIWSLPAAGQASAAHVTGRFGFAGADDAYQRGCGQLSMALGADVQGRRPIFPQLSVDRFVGSGGADIACIPVDPATGRAVGGLQLEGATRVGVGIGARAGRGPVQIEGVLLSGLITGRRGFALSEADDHRGVMPHVGGQGSLIFFRWIVLSVTTNWTRLSLDVLPPTAALRNVRTSWSPMTSGQIGVRWAPGGISSSR